MSIAVFGTRLWPRQQRHRKRAQHSLDPVGAGFTVGIGKEQNVALSALRTTVPRRCRPRVILTDDGHALQAGNLGGSIGRSIVDDDHFVATGLSFLSGQCQQAVLEDGRAVENWNDDGCFPRFTVGPAARFVDLLLPPPWLWIGLILLAAILRQRRRGASCFRRANR